ncbi:MAG: Transcriptional regulator, partial [bacterium]|nr:Transcriptional regulator [bacterium]
AIHKHQSATVVVDIREAYVPLMLDATVRQLQIFVAVAKHRSFTRAAEELRLTQPAVSMQVKALDELAGLPLFERLGRSVALTQAGVELAARGQLILRALADAEDALAALRGLKRGRLVVAVVSTAKYFAPKLLALFQREHADIELKLAVSNRDAVMQMLVGNDVDLALMGTPPAHLETTAFPFARHPLVVIAEPGHPLAKRRRVPVAALAQESFLVREPGSGTRAAMERFFAANRVRLSATTELDSNETIKQAVMAGMGLGFISQHAIALELSAGALTLVRVEGLPVLRNWNLVHRTDKRLSPAALAFKRFVLKEGRVFLSAWPGASER